MVTFGETKSVHYQSMKTREWILGGDTVDELNEYKNLGGLKNYIGSFSSNVDDNIEKTNNKGGMTFSSHLYRQKVNPFIICVKFWRQACLPSLLFGAELFTLAQGLLLNLNAVNHGFLKHIFYVPSFTPGPILLKMSGLNSVASEIAIKKLLFLGRLIIEPNMAPAVRNLFQCRVESYFDTNVTSAGVLTYFISFSYTVPGWKKEGTISSDDVKGSWGDWGAAPYCKKGVFASGFTIKMELKQGNKRDDTAANGVCLVCGTDNGVCSTFGIRGSWSKEIKCQTGCYMAGFKQQVEKPQGSGPIPWNDDSALTNVNYKCRKLENWDDECESITSVPEGTERKNWPMWGNWGRWQQCPKGTFICGIRTRVEPDQKSGDDTALNDIKHMCCRPDEGKFSIFRRFS